MTPRPELVDQPLADQKTAHAPRVTVLIWNDTVTTALGVIEVLQQVFRMTVDEAWEVMIVAHNTGVSLVEVVPLEVAELHVDQAHSIARGRGWPLTFTYEEE